MAPLEAFFASPITWGVVTLVALALALSGKLSTTAATWIVWIAAASAVFGVYRAELLLRMRLRSRLLILGCVVLALAAGATILNRWISAPQATVATTVAPQSEPEKTNAIPPKTNDNKTTQSPPSAKPPKMKQPPASPKDPKATQQQSGKDNTQTGPVTAGPCSNVQLGGSNNQATTNCGPPPLVLEVASIETGSSGKTYDPIEGFLKTEITIVPNQQVTAPFVIALDFDNPISKIGCTVKNVGAQMGGGPFTVGTHAKETVGTSIGPSHPLVVVVFSLLPVKLIGTPRVEY